PRAPARAHARGASIGTNLGSFVSQDPRMIVSLRPTLPVVSSNRLSTRHEVHEATRELGSRVLLQEMTSAHAMVGLSLRAWDRALQETVEAAGDRIAGGEEREEGF